MASDKRNPQYAPTIKNTRTDWVNTSDATTKRKAANAAATALHDNNPAMTKQQARQAFEALLNGTVPGTTATYGEYVAFLTAA